MGMPAVIRGKSKSPSNKWEKQDNAFTTDDVINAYLTGRKDGKSAAQVAKNALFDNNLNKAKELSEGLFKKLTDIGFNIDSIHIKAESIVDFTALIVTSKDDYINDGIRKAFSISRKIKQENQNESFNIFFTFTYAADTLKEEVLESDGFFLKYGNEAREL